MLIIEAGVLIGHHLVTDLRKKTTGVHGVDIKLSESAVSDAGEFELLDARLCDACLRAALHHRESYRS